MPSLVEMPDVVMNNILGKLNFNAIQTLRKVSHIFRSFIDEVRPDSCFFAVAIWITDSGDVMIHYGSEFNDDVQVYYKNHEDGCLVETINCKRVLRNESFIRRALEDFGQIMKNQKSRLKMFQLYRRHFGLDYNRFLKTLTENLTLLKVEKLMIESCQHHHIVPVMAVLDPESLEELRIADASEEISKNLEINEIVKLDHWRKIKRFEMSNCYISASDLKHFTHFSSTSVNLESVTAGDVKFLKETFLHRYPNSLEFHIYYKTFEDMNAFWEYMGPADIDSRMGDNNKSWYFRIPNSEYILEILHLYFEKPRISFYRSPLKWIVGKRIQ